MMRLFGFDIGINLINNSTGHRRE